jgi:hypothetical protein
MPTSYLLYKLSTFLCRKITARPKEDVNNLSIKLRMMIVIK